MVRVSCASQEAEGEAVMIEIKLWQLVCAIVAALMAGANIGFLFFAIVANSNYRDLQRRADRGEI